MIHQKRVLKRRFIQFPLVVVAPRTMEIPPLRSQIGWWRAVQAPGSAHSGARVRARRCPASLRCRSLWSRCPPQPAAPVGAGWSRRPFAVCSRNASGVCSAISCDRTKERRPLGVCHSDARGLRSVLSCDCAKRKGDCNKRCGCCCGTCDLCMEDEEFRSKYA